MEEVDHVGQDTSSHEVDEYTHDLASCVSRKQERCQVGEWHDRDWIEEEKNPDALVLQAKRSVEANDYSNGNVHLEDIADKVRTPISWKAYARDHLQVLDLTFTLRNDMSEGHARDQSQSN